MQFPPSFFEDEVRDGFFISGKMKRFWAGQIEVLDTIDKICRRHGITYHADCGTLLGAIRHGGFIPWDDDLDISMRRDQLDLFTKYALEELPEEYQLWDVEQLEEFDNTLTRVIHFNHIEFTPEMLLNNHGCPYGVGVDIFAVDNMAPTNELDEKQVELIKFGLNLGDKLKHTGSISYDEKTAIHNMAKSFGIKVPLELPLAQRVHMITRGLMEIYNDAPAKEATIMGNHIEGPDYRFPSEVYEHIIYVPFEGFQMPVPAQYDIVLKREYGDYMKPVRGFSAHDYPGFHKQDGAMRDVVGGIWGEYQFPKECLEAPQRKERVDELVTVRELLGMLVQAEATLEALLGQGIVEQVPELLEQCQNVAVQVGNSLEQVVNVMPYYYRVTGKEAVVQGMIGRLETFCEQVYHLYRYLLGEEEECPSFDVIRGLLAEVAGDLNGALEFVPRAVFLVSRVSQWNRIAPLVKKKQAEGWEILLMPVPWYEKDLLGKLGTLHFEKEEFDELGMELGIPVLQYDQIPLSQLLAEELYTQDYAGNCSSGTSLHPYFYTERLREVTKQLIYACPLVMDEIPVGDDRGFSTLDYCCKMPGVVWADKVLVQSPEMADAYVRALVDYAGKDSKAYWESHVDGDTLPEALSQFPNPVESQRIPETWKAALLQADGSRKKLLCFHMGCAVLLQNPERGVEKLEEILNTFEAQQEKLSVLWWMDKGFYESLEGKQSDKGKAEGNPSAENRSEGNQKLIARVRALQERFSSSSYGILEDSPSRAVVTQLCDAYYGDGSYVMNLFCREKKPVMQMDVMV